MIERTRVKVRQDSLFHILNSDNQKTGISKYGNILNFYGVIVSNNSNHRYKIKFGDLRTGNQFI